MQARLSDVADRYTVAAACSDAISTIEDARPDLILIERPTLTQMELTTLLDWTQPGRWPPLLLVDAPAVDAGDGAKAIQRLV